VDLGLTRKNALVTGGSHGIGLSIALLLAKEGANVAICGRDKIRLRTATDYLEEMGTKVMGIFADVLKPAGIKRTVDAVARSWKTIHILVNNVGGGGRWGQPDVLDTSEQVWIDVYNKNAMAAVRFTKLVLPFMKKQKWGRIVTIASMHGREAGGRPWFNMAKSAEISLMKSLSLDKKLVRDGITFNTVAPGNIMIPGTGWEKERKRNPAEFRKMVDSSFPLGRLGSPDEVACVAVFLCSSLASLVNGACVAVDGGESRSF